MCTTHIIVKLPQTLVILVIIFTFIKTTDILDYINLNQYRYIYDSILCIL